MAEDVLWRFGPVTLYSLGSALAAGFLAATAAAVPLLRRIGVRQRAALRLMLELMIGTVLGARVAALLAAGQGFAAVLAIPPDGLSYYGGLVAGVAVIVAFCHRSGVPLLAVTDALAPPAALGLALGSAAPLATNLVQLRSGGAAWLNILPFTAAWAAARLLWRHRRRARFPGEPTLLFLAADSVLRMVLGLFWTFGARADGPARLGPPLTLLLAALAWFTLRGAAARRSFVPWAPGLEAAWLRRAAPWPWIAAYLGVATFVLLRLRWV